MLTMVVVDNFVATILPKSGTGTILQAALTLVKQIAPRSRVFHPPQHSTALVAIPEYT